MYTQKHSKNTENKVVNCVEAWKWLRNSQKVDFSVRIVEM